MRGFDAEGVDRVLDELGEQSLQSDERFAEWFIEARRRRGSGPLRIRAELRERGIDDDLIGRYLDADPDLWDKIMRRVHDRKYGSELPDDLKEWARRARFLEHRGFPLEQIRRFLSRQ